MNVTTLVPVLNPIVLREQLASLRRQTERPKRVIIADIGPEAASAMGSQLASLLVEFSDLGISVCSGPNLQRSTGPERCRLLLESFSAQQDEPTELIHVLADNSLLDPEFYAHHFIAHRAGTIQCAISQPWNSTDVVEFGKGNALPPMISEPDYSFLAVSSNAVFGLILGPPYPSNWLGTLSNATFRSQMADSLTEPSLLGIPFSGQESLGFFLKAASTSPLGFVRMPLGRPAPPDFLGGLMPDPTNLAQARLAFFALAIAGRRLGFLNAEQCGLMFAAWGSFVYRHHSNEAEVADLCGILPSLAGGERNSEAKFVRLWNEYLHLLRHKNR